MRRYRVLIVILLLLLTFGLAYLSHYHYLHRYDALIGRVSSQYGLDPALVRAVIYEESYFDQNAHSGAGAVGLMQVTSIIVREWTRVTGKQHLALVFPNAVDGHTQAEALRMKNEQLLYYPEINLHLGCWYLDQLMKRYSDQDEPLPIVLASYNAGPTNAQRWQQRVTSDPLHHDNLAAAKFIEQIDFPETKSYVKSILARYKKYKESKGDPDMITWFSFYSSASCASCASSACNRR